MSTVRNLEFWKCLTYGMVCGVAVDYQRKYHEGGTHAVTVQDADDSFREETDDEEEIQQGLDAVMTLERKVLSLPPDSLVFKELSQSFLFLPDEAIPAVQSTITNLVLDFARGVAYFKDADRDPDRFLGKIGTLVAPVMKSELEADSHLH